MTGVMTKLESAGPKNHGSNPSMGKIFFFSTKSLD